MTLSIRSSFARRHIQPRFAPWLFLAPLLMLAAVFIAFPLLHSFFLSLFTTIGPGSRRFVGLGNYRFLILHDPLFWLALVNTIAYTLGSLLIQLPCSLLLALALNQPAVRFKSILRLSFFSTYLVGQVFAGIIFAALLDPHLGLVNQLLSRLLQKPINIGWLSQPNLALPATLLASAWLSVGFGMVYFLAALQAVDPALYEAADLDGAGAWAKFRFVTVPGIRPVVSFLVIAGTIAGFQVFELPFVLMQGPGPGYRAMTLVMYLYSAGFDRGDLGYAAAIGWLLVVTLALLVLVQLKLLSVRRD